jgi:predicted negative regulator of RcsB-dependent stress response
MYEGIGDAFQLDGNSKLAIASYKQALERNSNAPELKEKLTTLEEN